MKTVWEVLLKQKTPGTGASARATDGSRASAGTRRWPVGAGNNGGIRLGDPLIEASGTRWRRVKHREDD